MTSTAITKNDQQGPPTFQQLLQQQSGAIEKLAEGVLTPDRFISLVTLASRKNSKILQCGANSIVSALHDCAKLGLEPDGIQGALIPYGTELTFQPMYRGYIELAHREGVVKTLAAYTVREGDEFVVEYGEHHIITHKPRHTNKKREAIAYYAIAHLATGGVMFRVMEAWQMAEHKQKFTRTTDAWAKSEEEMCLKTVIKKLFKWLPSTVKMRDALNIDNAAEAIEMSTSTVTDGPVLKGNDRLLAAAGAKALPGPAEKDVTTAKAPEPAKQDGPPLDADGFPIDEPGDFASDEHEAPEGPAMLSVVEVLRGCPSTKASDLAAHRAQHDHPERSAEDRAMMFAAIKARVAFLRKPTEDPIASIPAEEQAHALAGLTAAAKAGVQWCAEIVARFGPAA